jgi:ribulose-phosphate 3-epimerase
MQRIISPSVLSADFLNLGKDIEMLNNSSAQWIHCDIMDGVFVPNISFGFPVIKAIRSMTSKILDVHLMIVQPERYINDFIDAGADVLTLHYEAVTHLNRAVSAIKEKGVMAGVSLNPHTPVSVLEEILPFLDLVLIMSVNPGYGGQKFINGTVEKVKKINELKQKLNPSLVIQLDGGVNSSNSLELYSAGVNSLVAGNAVFSSDNPILEIEKILHSK